MMGGGCGGMGWGCGVVWCGVSWNALGKAGRPVSLVAVTAVNKDLCEPLTVTLTNPNPNPNAVVRSR